MTPERHPYCVIRILSLSVVLLFMVNATAWAQGVRFSRGLSDHAVLQRGKPITITGFADKGRAVTVAFAGQSKKATADDSGAWSVVLGALPANSNGADLVATAGGDKVTLSDVVVGDVILFARQTSIDVSLGRDKQGQAQAANLPAGAGFRVMHIKTIPAATPQADLAPKATDGWVTVDKKSALSMSAAAFYVGRDLSAKLDVPVGIIDLDMGPNFTLGWISRQAIAGNNDYYGRPTRITAYAAQQEAQAEAIEAQTRSAQETAGQTPIAEYSINGPMYPAAGYNAVLHPLRNLALKAILVQLGNDYPYMAYEQLRKEGRSFDRGALDTAWWANYLHRKRGYRAGLEVVPRIPSLWRRSFGDEQLAMGLIMPPSSDLATYAMHNREIRELQRRTAESNQAVGLILPGNAHVPFSGQPADEALLAKRSLAWLIGSVYQREGVVPCGPLFERMQVDYSKAQIFFKPGTADGLKAGPGALDQFEVAGVEGKFFPAEASIDGQTIRLQTNQVSRIANVRYNFKQRPNQGLENRAGLPAIPFLTGEHEYEDVPRRAEANLPPEYSTPARDWAEGDIAIISGGGASFDGGPGLLGATGVVGLPFGPNIRVTHVIPGSPADGRIQVGDMIYKVNDKMFGENHLKDVAEAIEYAESEAGGGKISISLRREGELMDVGLQIEVLGTYSATSPYDCPKADRIVANSEAYLAARGGIASGASGGGWLYSDSLFLLGAGTPEYQGLVRRFIYQKMADLKKKGAAPGGWMGAHGSLLFGEYYLATGDRNVLPYLKMYCDALAATQCREESFPDLSQRSIGGWRHNYPGGEHYGMIPTIGLPAMIGMTLATEAGVDVDRDTYRRGMFLFRDHQAEMGYNDYAATAPLRTAPRPIEPDKVETGMLSSHNGSAGMAAILFHLVGDTRIAHLNSTYCAYAWNNCNEGHGSNFFNGMWTPLGANMHSKSAFIHFMRNHYWFRDLKRMYDHGYLASRDKSPSAGHDLALVVPRQRLRILGAPQSVFAHDAPAVLKPALDAFYGRDYDQARQLAAKLTQQPDLASDDRNKAEQLERAARELQQSIESDLAKVQRLVQAGKLYEASLDLDQLKGVAPEADARLAAIEQAVTAPAAQQAFKADKSRYDARQKSVFFKWQSVQAGGDQNVTWHSLSTEAIVNRRLANAPGMTDDEHATRWKAKIVEDVSQAPAGWTAEDFDDSGWGTTTLPVSWHLNHALLARTTFEVADKQAIERLRVSCHPYRQINIVVYLNGKVVAKFNQCEAVGGWVHGELPAAALKLLNNGRNTLAFSTTNDWRWSARGGVSNGGFGLKLDMGKSNE